MQAYLPDTKMLILLLFDKIPKANTQCWSTRYRLLLNIPYMFFGLNQFPFAQSVPGVVESMKVVTAENSERVARYAFEYAKSTGRTKVTTIHKANIMKLSDGLFLETSRRVAKEYPEIKHDDMIIDNCCMQLVSNPHQFEVMNMTNLYGTITSNVICGLMGGAGLLSGKNYGDLVSIYLLMGRNGIYVTNCVCVWI